MVNLSDIIEKDNGSLRAIKRQLKAKYENERDTLVEYKDTLISSNRSAEKA